MPRELTLEKKYVVSVTAQVEARSESDALLIISQLLYNGATHKPLIDPRLDQNSVFLVKKSSEKILLEGDNP